MNDCPLTRRELRAVEGLAEGLQYKQIAARHGVTHGTIRNQVCSAYRKLGVTDRAQAVLVAERAGWIKARESPSQELLFDVRAALHRLEQRLPLDRRQRARLAQFERELWAHADRGPVGDAMLDELGAVMRFYDRYGVLPSRPRPRRSGDE